MSTMPWLLRRPVGGRHAIGRPLRQPADIDGWLDTIHRLASARAAEREQLAPAARALRARLRNGPR